MKLISEFMRPQEAVFMSEPTQGAMHTGIQFLRIQFRISNVKIFGKLIDSATDLNAKYRKYSQK